MQMDGPGGHHPEWGNPIPKEHTWYALTDKWILAQKFRISKVQFAKPLKLKKKEDPSVDTSFLLRMGNKIPMERVTETKFRAEPEGTIIQRLPHLGIHLYICQLLVDPHKRQLLSAGSCWHLPTVWVWWLFTGWYPSGEVSGWSFIQALLWALSL